MKIYIRTIDGTDIDTIRQVTSCVVSETLLTEKTIYFETILSENLEMINDSTKYMVEFNGDLFDVVNIKKSLKSGLYFISFECEHISYRLSDEQFDFFSHVGTPREILALLLSNTGFNVSTVEPTDEVTFSLQETATKRATLMKFASENNWDLYFWGRNVSLIYHRGQTTKKKLIDKNVVNISKTISFQEKTEAYELTLYNLKDFSIGDEVWLNFPKLGIDKVVRVLGMKYQPFTSKEVSLEVGAYTSRLEMDNAKIQTNMLKKDSSYYGVKISNQKGLEITGAKTKSIFNADEFRMQAENENGHLQDKLFFDPISSKYKFVGDVSVEGGDINIGGNFIVDKDGNARLTGDATIYGGRYYAGTPNSSNGFTQMTESGFEVFNKSNDLKLKFGYTSMGEDFPFVQLGSGRGNDTDYGLIKKFSDGLWIGNAEPEDDSGDFVAKDGYNGLFFRFNTNSAFIVSGTVMKSLYTGAAIARFGF